MTASKVNDYIVGILCDMIVDKIKPDLDKKAINANTPLLDDGLGLDSIMVVDLIVAVENYFGFNFAEDDLSLDSFASLTALSKVIARHEIEAPVA